MGGGVGFTQKYYTIVIPIGKSAIPASTPPQFPLPAISTEPFSSPHSPSLLGHKCLYDYGKGKPTNADAIIDQSVAKIFPDGVLYRGIVVGYNDQKRWWRISYEDGDEEQLNFRELCMLDTPPDFTSFRYSADGEPSYFSHLCLLLHTSF